MPSSLSFQQLFPLPLLYIWDGKHYPLKQCIYLGSAVFVSTILVGLTILITEALPPTFVDPNTGTLRYISDGFADYRAAPFVCLFFDFVIVLCIVLFVLEAINYVPPTQKKAYRHVWIFFLCLTAMNTLNGFAILAINASGAVHYAGAGLFIVMHLLMQFIFFHIVLHVIREDSKKMALHYEQYISDRQWKIAEYSIIGIGSLFAILFGAFLLAALNQEENSSAQRLYTLSAAAEYVVFATFIALNIVVSLIMTFVGLHFQPVVYVANQQTSPNSQTTIPILFFWVWEWIEAGDGSSDQVIMKHCATFKMPKIDM